MLLNRLYIVPLDFDDNKILTLENFEIYGEQVLDSDLINYKEQSSKCKRYGVLDVVEEEEETEENINNSNKKELFKNSNIIEGFASDDRLINSFNSVNKLCEAI